MNTWDKIHFHGTFRNYQQKVLDHAASYLDDGRIHIVAAPGSGKTVLGLELIRRMGKPCLILSPTTAIRRQWGERLKEMFLDEPSDFSRIYSGTLHDLKLFNSITYQALYKAMEKISSEPKPASPPPSADSDDSADDSTDGSEDAESEDSEDSSDAAEDFSQFPLFERLREAGIETICLDEAHHLRNEWQKALEAFIAALDQKVKIIALTATPPYDSESAEWKRYQKVCGDIDEEIFVPELVGQRNLCPHQDYIYFNYPTLQERERFDEFREASEAALRELAALPFWGELSAELNAERDYEKLFVNPKAYIDLLVLLEEFGFPADSRLVKELCAGSKLPPFSTERAESALQFLLDDETRPEALKESIKTCLKKHGSYEKKRVCLHLNDALKRALISSLGKLDSIKVIAANEWKTMGEELRMLVLTDYIHKDELGKIGREDAEFRSVNIVSIFENLRRQIPEAKIGVLSGSLVILPSELKTAGLDASFSELPGTNYSLVSFTGGTRQAVPAVGKLFEKGAVRVLVGTKSLLGEGWDSPCINTLILASFVGSYVLSNQMRGRAIRSDKNNPDKVSNIWHLVTLEPEYLFRENAAARAGAYARGSKNKIVSYDFEILKRRFEGFMGPHYEEPSIESGIQRISILKPPFDEKGFAEINRKMLERAQDRSSVRKHWFGKSSRPHYEVAVETAIPTERRLPVYPFVNFIVLMLSLIVEGWLIPLGGRLFFTADLPTAMTPLILAFLLFILIYHIVKMLLLHGSPARSIRSLGKAVYQTLRDCELISPSARVSSEADDEGMYVSLRLLNASVHDQNIFNRAMAEMLSPIENPRYLLIAKRGKNRYNYRLSFACPSIIGAKKEYVEQLRSHLAKLAGKFEAVYTYREKGRRLILECRRRAYITHNERALDKHYKVTNYE